MRTARLLARYAALLNRFGPDSREERAFRRAHARDANLASLLDLARLLKRALAR